MPSPLRRYAQHSVCAIALSVSLCLCWAAWASPAGAAPIPGAVHHIAARALPAVSATPQPEDLAPQREPDWVGLATWYGGPHLHGRLTRSGELFDPHAATCAVPDEQWEQLAGKVLCLQDVASGGYVRVRVNDSGYLSQAGRFAWDVRWEGELQVARWWPDDAGLPIVVDLAPTVHRQLSPTGDTIQVRVWIEEPVG